MFQCQDDILVGGTAKEMYFPIFTRLTFGYLVRRHLGVANSVSSLTQQSCVADTLSDRWFEIFGT